MPVDGQANPLELLDEIFVADLFGQFTYELRRAFFNPEDVPLNRLILLYGDNGSGKTTVLQLIWHLLSPAENRAHRTFLARTPFSRLRVFFGGSFEIRVAKVDGLIGDFSLDVYERGQEIIHVDYRVNSRGDIVPPSVDDSELNFERNVLQRLRDLERLQESGSPSDNDDDDDHSDINDDGHYREFLQNLEVNPFFLADDRNIYSDQLDDDSTVRELTARERMKLDRATFRSGPENARESISRELESCFNRLNQQMWRLTFGGQSAGSAGADTVYRELLQNLAVGVNRPSIDPTIRSADRPSLEVRAHELEVRSSKIAEFGLAPPFDASEFAALLPRLDDTRRQIAEDVLTPYLDSVERRIVALTDAESQIRTFRDHANRFLHGKRVDYEIRNGVSISTNNGIRLAPENLSSGEQQLMLLICNTMLARSRSRLFLIDEPELSLNVKWQRRILHTLLACTEGSSVQFVIATHSVEMITGHRQSLVRLER